MKEVVPPVAVKFPVSTLITICFTILIVHLLRELSPLLFPLLIAILLAASLTPVVNWMTARKVPRRVAIVAIAFVLGLALTILIISILPEFYRQGVAFAENLPKMREDLLQKLGTDSPLHGLISTGLQKDFLMPKTDQLKQILGAGNLILGGFAEVSLIFIMSIYLIMDGPNSIEWVSAFFQPSTQAKIKETKTEVSKIISAYVLGQFVTSALSFLFVLIVLSALGVPNAVLLATISGILDVLPVLGFFIAVVPALLFASSISLNMAWIVLAAYIFYHSVENNFIVPWVYGKRMRVSGFVVFFTLVAAGLVGGIEGAIVILPIVASYPIIERIWLKRYVSKEALKEHAPE